jgi:hypothetical protein
MAGILGDRGAAGGDESVDLEAAHLVIRTTGTKERSTITCRKQGGLLDRRAGLA